jgi:tRNA A-37 threonylcarbamoyl transferase component Bud32
MYGGKSKRAGKNYTMITFSELATLQYTFNQPFQLAMEDGEVVQVDRVLRFIPKKRLVASGTWKEKSIVIKLFFHKKNAKRHMEKDAAGVKLLQDNKVPTPALYYKGYANDKRIAVLIFDYISIADNLEDIWVNRKSVEEVLHVMRAVTIELATQHVLGVLQHDLHLKNFLITEKTIYTLDGGQVELCPMLLPKEASMKNLALFLSQFGVGVDFYQDMLFKSYAKARGWRLKKEDSRDLFFMIKKWNEQRWLSYSKKIDRNATDFSRSESWKKISVYNRRYAGPELLNFLKDPTVLFSSSGVSVLKAGRSSTVVKATLDGRDYVIKRHNMKSIWHRLRRCFRPTRAYASWRLAHKLQLFGVNTATPVAYSESNVMGVRGASYYVTENVAGMHAGEFFHQQQDVKQVDEMIEKIANLLKNLAKLDITHGDLKATNILIDQRNQPVLIDLDGASEHYSKSSLHKAWRKEIKRFLENFRDRPFLLQKFTNVMSAED